MDVLSGPALPPGYGSVNPFVAVRGPDGAAGFLRFVADVLGGREIRAAHTVDADGLLIHAEVVTAPTPFHGGQRLARVRDPWSTLWWLVEYGPSSTAPSEAPDELPSWQPDPDAPPSYVHRTIDEAMTSLRG